MFFKKQYFMKTEFIQKIVENALLRKATAAMPMLRHENLSEKDVSELLREFDRSGDFSMIKAMIETGQDPKEIKEIAIGAIENISIVLKERFLKHLETLSLELEKRVQSS
ncbi:hypothetical protein A3J61_01525 [Candidatus Nomurabacteria bacterium RIFCSPHIGHO2_02_FULL_38_15]|uniref:Uncharacterized protein n=1 Tax=Candidatus Nomurabacteria bacterium RIFCSPHIGHO2_02_FULL_38_15 TaxID=1801752 RepID=A0A1F6VR36_9BACT|nr:MAG: hypothetical protein A3J61_01525 [Candidatus Nomurabacteria bacterium RIFCSPHIGHO2_02_FULL_38_15]